MKYNSNANKVVLNIENKLKKASDVSSLQRIVGSYLWASNWDRITQGIAVNGSAIGSYSNRPMYVNPNLSPKKFAPMGKNGQVKFKNGRPHRTKYFIGYREFRGQIGRDITKVNLQLTGRLRLDWILNQQGSNWVIGWRSKYGALVSRGNEQRFGKLIFGISKKDQEQIVLIQNEFIKKALA